MTALHNHTQTYKDYWKPIKPTGVWIKWGVPTNRTVLISPLTLSTCPFASGRPLDTKRSVIPNSSHSVLNAPINSWSELHPSQPGFPNLRINSLYNHSANVVDRLSHKGTISTHLLKQSTATTQWWWPSHSGSKLAIKSNDQLSPGARGRSFGHKATCYWNVNRLT